MRFVWLQNHRWIKLHFVCGGAVMIHVGKFRQNVKKTTNLQNTEVIKILEHWRLLLSKEFHRKLATYYIISEVIHMNYIAPYA